MKFKTGIVSGKAPVDNGSRIIALGLKRPYLPSQLHFIRYSTPQAMLAEDAQLYLCHPFDKLRTGLSQLPCFGV